MKIREGEEGGGKGVWLGIVRWCDGTRGLRRSGLFIYFLMAPRHEIFVKG